MATTSRKVTSPALSIIVPVYNAERDLPRFFTYLNRQTIAKKDLEVLMIDGGSTDKTKEICRKNGATIIHNPYKLAEPGAAIGFARARAPLVMMAAVDNVFPQKDALETMVRIFDEPTITAAFPKHDTGPGDTVYSRYINTFTDPFTHFVYQDAANARTFHKIYKTIVHTSTYDIYDYSSNSVQPILALAQGFTLRKDKMPARRERSDDVLSVYTLIKNHERLAYIYSVSLYHYTIRDTKQFIAKQRRAVENALLRGDSGITKRGAYLTSGQKARMYLFVPYSFTIILPLIQSTAGAVMTGEAIWLAHWILCWLASVVIVVTAVPLYININKRL